ncbi:MAG TPA: alpha-amylase/4-alpha-glucanotransferase domain-containing protein [Dehalococcoidia bacterium]|nr:alpha-amylase/4-alpha-glucanotransferase domain-containing protein [Dehalococcoidia bacterium]
MKPRLYLGLVLHNHQPVGNYGFVVEQVYQQSYLPMLEALERHPGVRVALHNSGSLFDWILANRPDYVTRLRGLCDRGQIEMLTGGYYEPILPMIPDADKVGQIRKLSAFIEEHFRQTPTGLWLTERVWEPGLPAPLAAAGVQWSLVDDAHFRTVGVPEEALDGYYVTEDQGQRVKLFAGSQRLRYTIPWHDVDDVISELRALSHSRQGGAPYVVLGDDGEKFGAWPTTYAHVWEKGWIERFFSAIEAEHEWLETITPGDYARRFEARGLVYLPAASYAEMMEWAMPAAAAAEYHRATAAIEAEGREDVRKYMRGGFWRTFLAKYPEANDMHKRGLRIDRKLESVRSNEARDALWKAQCNCPYWHGVFGGLYLRNIRAATLSNLVRAERLADEAAGAVGVRVGEQDYDFDGRDEVLLQTPWLTLLLHPEDGGMLSELDVRQRDWAMLGVLARRREAYHDALLGGEVAAAGDGVANIHGALRLKEQGLADGLTFDRLRRGGLQEWILPADADVAAFARGGSSAQFDPSGTWSKRVSHVEGGVVAVLSRRHDNWSLWKQLDVPAQGETFTVTYTCTNGAREPRRARFVAEWNFSVPQAPDGDDRIARVETAQGGADLAGPPGALDGLRQFTVRGSAPWGIEARLEEPCDVWHFPVETVSSSEGGLERVWQGASVSVTRVLDLAPGESWSSTVTWRTVDVDPVEYAPGGAREA